MARWIETKGKVCIDQFYKKFAKGETPDARKTFWGGVGLNAFSAELRDASARANEHSNEHYLVHDLTSCSGGDLINSFC